MSRSSVVASENRPMCRRSSITSRMVANTIVVIALVMGVTIVVIESTYTVRGIYLFVCIREQLASEIRHRCSCQHSSSSQATQY